jgi:hypothetical protein
MLNRTLKTLAAVAPGHAFDTMFAIAALEKQLGLPYGRPTFNGPRAKARLSDLQAQLAAKSAPAVQAAPAASVPVATITPSPEVDAAVRIQRMEARFSLPITALTDLLSGDTAAVRLAEIEKLAAGPELRGIERAANAFKRSAAAHAAQAAKPAPVATVAPVPAGSMPTEKLVALCEHVFGHTPQSRDGCLYSLHLSGVTVPGIEPDPHRIEVTGFNRMFRDAYQAKADSFLANNPK